MSEAYVYGTESADRFKSLSGFYDGDTTRAFQECGLAPGWQCLVVGAGAGTFLPWLTERVGASGRVVATDLNTRFLEALKLPNLEVLRHDVLKDDFPAGTFDLIHTRLVLMHIPQALGAVRRMIEWLKPGGTILLEELDTSSRYELAQTSDRAKSLLAAVGKFYRAQMDRVVKLGGDPTIGRQLFSCLRGHGFEGVAALVTARVICAGSPGIGLIRGNIEQTKDALIESGAITADEIAAAVKATQDPEFAIPAPYLVTVRGRKPR